MGEKISGGIDYNNFRSSVPMNKICADNNPKKYWKIFDAGPKDVTTPLIFLSPACGTADIYFRQLSHLSAEGYRVISVESPPYWTVDDWCVGFRELLEYLNIEKAHLFGASLGGYLAQKFVEHTKEPIVISLFLCNTFIDTDIFNYTETSALFWLFPMSVLKRLIGPSLTTKNPDQDIYRAVEFVAEKVDELSQADLASRLKLNCSGLCVSPENVHSLQAVTIMDVFDDCALNNPAREDIYNFYPGAKLAQLKSGGNFPYLSKYDEVNMHIKIHLRKFEETPFTASKKI